MNRKIIVPIATIIAIILFLQFRNESPKKIPSDTIVRELISKHMLEAAGNSTYTANEVVAILEPGTNQYVQFIEIEELSGTAGASGFVITSDKNRNIKILGSFLGSKYIISETAKVSAPGNLTFTEAQSTSVCSYTEQVMIVDLSKGSITPKGDPVEKNDCNN